MAEHEEERMQAAADVSDESHASASEVPERSAVRHEVPVASVPVASGPSAGPAIAAVAAAPDKAPGVPETMNEDAAPASRAARRGPAGVDLDFSELYEEYFAFVWRTLRRYGVPDGALDDAAQDVFVVVHHQLAAFEGRSTVRTWLFGIARRVARNHRPNGRSFAMDAEHLEIAGGKAQGAQGRPGASVEAAEMLRYLLDKLASDKRDAFILMELEQMTIAEAADALGVNRNTMYSRLRAARQELEQAVTRLTLQERAALQGATGTATGNESTPPDQERSTPWKS